MDPENNFRDALVQQKCKNLAEDIPLSPADKKSAGKKHGKERKIKRRRRRGAEQLPLEMETLSLRESQNQTDKSPLIEVGQFSERVTHITRISGAQSSITEDSMVMEGTCETGRNERGLIVHRASSPSNTGAATQSDLSKKVQFYLSPMKEKSEASNTTSKSYSKPKSIEANVNPKARKEKQGIEEKTSKTGEKKISAVKSKSVAKEKKENKSESNVKNVKNKNISHSNVEKKSTTPRNSLEINKSRILKKETKSKKTAIEKNVKNSPNLPTKDSKKHMSSPSYSNSKPSYSSYLSVKLSLPDLSPSKSTESNIATVKKGSKNNRISLIPKKLEKEKPPGKKGESRQIAKIKEENCTAKEDSFNKKLRNLKSLNSRKLKSKSVYLPAKKRKHYKDSSSDEYESSTGDDSEDSCSCSDCLSSSCSDCSESCSCSSASCTCSCDSYSDSSDSHSDSSNNYSDYTDSYSDYTDSCSDYTSDSSSGDYYR